MANQATMHDSDDVTVSRPAIVNMCMMFTTSSSSRLWPSSSKCMNWSSRSSCRAPSARRSASRACEAHAQLDAGGDAEPLLLLHGGALVLEDAVLHGDQEVHVLERHAEEAQEDDRRQRHAEGVVELDPAIADEAVDELVGQLADVGLQQRHLPRGEERVEQPAVVAVDVAVEVQRDQRVGRSHAEGHAGGGIGRHQVGVAAGGHDVVHAEEADAELPAHHRRRAPDLVDHRLRRSHVERAVRLVRDERPGAPGSCPRS